MIFFRLNSITFFLYFLFVASTQGQSSYYTEIEVNSITITGSSNVSSFVFKQNIDSIISRPSPLGVEYLRIAIPVKDFKTGNPIMYRNFINLIKAKDYPNIYIDVPANEFSFFNNRHAILQEHTFYITITNVTRFYKIKADVTLEGMQNYKTIGKLKLNLLDFNLTPPQKLLGLIKVNKYINIDFCLFLHLLGHHWVDDHTQQTN